MSMRKAWPSSLLNTGQSRPWRWLAAQHPGRPRYLFGHSLGGAIAVRVASEVDDVAGLPRPKT